MKITDKEFYVVLKDEEKGIARMVEFLQKDLEGDINKNLVLDFSGDEDLKTAEVLNILPLSRKYRSRKRSFVIVSQTINLDEIPEELAVVPTIGEAEDLIQMEEIERDLGF